MFDIVLLRYHAGALAQYWWHSAPDRHREISTHWSQLIASATLEHDVLVREAGADNWVSREGYRTVYRERSKFEAAVKVAEADLRAYGAKYRILDPNSLENAEPAIKSGIFAGAIHWLDPWTVSNPGGLVSAYAQLFRKLGGTKLRGDAQTLAATALGWSINTSNGPISAGSAVVALGPWSPDLLEKFGYRVPLVRKRGYHMHYQTKASLNPLLDASLGYVLAPMAQGVRITTGAELTSPDAAAVSAQLAIGEREIRKLLDLGTPTESELWFGTRPCTPDMLPVLGNTPRHRTLWVNFGHRHQDQPRVACWPSS